MFANNKEFRTPGLFLLQNLFYKCVHVSQKVTFQKLLKIFQLAFFEHIQHNQLQYFRSHKIYQWRSQ